MEKKPKNMRLFYEREKHYKILLYKEEMKLAMVYRYSDMNVYQVIMIVRLLKLLECQHL